MITLPLTLGEWLKTTTKMDSLMMDLSLAYNGIIGKTSQAFIGVIPSVRHQVIKCSTQNSVEFVRGDQPTTRNCYYIQVKIKGKLPMNSTSDLDVCKGE